nr:hypothetical protein [Anaerolineae bacterium]
MKTYIVDTHTLAWYLDDDPRLGAQAEAVLDDPHVRIIVPAIVLVDGILTRDEAIVASGLVPTIW